MEQLAIAHEEKDMMAEGKEDFQKFYSANRKSIFRGADGIEFPIIADQEVIKQGIGPTIAYLKFPNKLDNFFSVGTLHKEWVNGIHVSLGNPDLEEHFLTVLRYLKSNNMKLQVDTDGRNSSILRSLLEEQLADEVIMNVLGPLEIYKAEINTDIEFEEVKQSILLTTQFPKYSFNTTIGPIANSEKLKVLSPEDVREVAKLIEEVTGTKKHPYFLHQYKAPKNKGSLKELEGISLFPYRTAARTYLVFTEIVKQ